jgi:hypothetical protein
MHTNSILSYHQITNLSERYKRILEIYQNSPLPLTDRDILIQLGANDMNYCRPRISELIDKGLLREVGDCKDRLTGKTVRLVQVNDDDRQMKLF